MSHRQDRDRDYEQRNNRPNRDDYRSRGDRDRGGNSSRDNSTSMRAQSSSSGRDRDRRDRSDRRRGSPLSYDAEYESRKFRDRREREFHEKYGRRSRSRENERNRSSRRHNEDNRRDYRRETSSYSDDSSRDTSVAAKKEKREELSEKATASSTVESRLLQQKTESDYLAKLSDEKLQETYERYENDPDFDITDGLLDNIVIDKEKIHREMQERLRQHLLSEGKVYPPPPKPEPQQTTIFANDGSFLDMFKKMQEEQQQVGEGAEGSAGVAEPVKKKEAEVKRPLGPMFGKRRGGKILKTGIVAKKRPIEDTSADAAPGDAWSQYMKEVKRYKAVSCDVDNKNRPLVK